ncbi:hypothetical protein B0F90DRAFT_559655 [Multifurca ochricompacta]|uniref:DUF962-domain-containing protein n=1 Tax=Multifurca ochricompacta TaxID=376703 RepID=A0AAD4QPY0_9AGAM|nr:hypothetical protein B0F90DRAFT_559655 [Multifurca ochricompacta]
MAASDLLNVRKQLAFYGAYHSHPINILIHIICVPLIMWSFQVAAYDLPRPTFLPQIHYHFNDYLNFEVTYGTLQGFLWLAYYHLLEPSAALLYAPQAILSVLTANAFAQRADHLRVALVVHVACWIAQFIGHGFAEGRSPALLDNIVGALVLAPFFVHLEILFKLGYKPTMYRQLRNDVGVEIAKFRKIKGDTRRAAERREI